MNSQLCNALNLTFPLIQAPMAGVSTPALAAAVSNAGALGSLGVGAATPEQAGTMIRQAQALTRGPLNVNVFCHAPARRDRALEAAWIARFAEQFRQFGSTPPEALSEIYQTFTGNEAMLAVLLETRPAAVSFHFGLPSPDFIRQLQARGIVTLATATSVSEARAIEAAGIDFIVAQGIEAGGHRGLFDPQVEDQALPGFTLVQAIRRVSALPIIAAGGVMDGAGIAAMLALGADGVQLGTAFILCPESAASPAYRQLMKSERAASTVMTAAISGRPARCISNDFCRLTRDVPPGEIPDYPLTYALGKALAAAASAQGEEGYGAQWAGQGAPLARELPAGALVSTLVAEWRSAESLLQRAEGGQHHAGKNQQQADDIQR